MNDTTAGTSADKCYNSNAQPSITTNTTTPTTLSPQLSHLQHNSSKDKVHVYTKRWLMLGIFVVLSASNAFQWIEYSIITNVVCDYYGWSIIAICNSRLEV
jgi:FLVCR family feline leukemia virus subgroup C receptor-related protein